MGLDSRAAKRKMYRGTMMFPTLQMVEETAPKEQEEKKAGAATGKLSLAAEWKCHAGDCTSVAYNRWTDQLITGGRDSNVLIWDIADQAEKGKLRNTRDIECVLLVNEKTLATGDRDGTIKLWDLEKSTDTLSLRGHSNEVKSIVQATDDPNVFVSSSMDKLIKVWDGRSGKQVASMEGHERGVKALTISAACLFSGSNDDTIKLWDLKQHKFVYNLEGHQKYVSSLLVKGTTLFSGSADETVKVWDLNSLKCTHTLGNEIGAVHALAFHGGYLVGGGESAQIRTWAAGSGFAEEAFPSCRSGLWNLLSARGSFFGAGMDGSVHVFAWA
jgi:WD40 repeat protein